MITIKRFNEMVQSFDYQRIKNDLKSSYGWGEGSMSLCSQFEENSEYFENPSDERDYVDQFHIYLTHLFSNRLRGSLNKNIGLRLGEWSTGVKVSKPTNFYNKLT
jgi:hypothetical protein